MQEDSVKKMIRSLFLMVTYYCCLAEANESCQSMYFSGQTDLALRGHWYRNVTGISLIRCGTLCLSDTRCLSINYSQREKLCELNGASASQFPQALVESSGCSYYGPEKKSCNSVSSEETLHQACKEDIENDPEVLRSQETFLSDDLTHAREHCAQCGMQLCSLAQLKAAYDAGYRNDQWGLVDIQGRDAKVALCGTYVNKPGECFYVDEEEPSKSTIPNTPRVAVSASAYCCIPTL